MHQNEYDFDYEKLNHLLDRSLREGYLLLGEPTKRLARLVLENVHASVSLGELQHTVSIPQSFDMALEFFEEIRPQYAYQFQNIMKESFTEMENGRLVEKEPSVSVKSLDETQNSECLVKGNGKVALSLRGNVADVGLIVHEMTHKFNHPFESGTVLRYYLNEIPPLSLEFVLYQFLLEKRSEYKNDLELAMRMRMVNEVRTALTVAVLAELFELYLANGKLDESILREFDERLAEENSIYSNMIRRSWKYYLKRKMTDKYFIQVQQVQHLVGFVFSCDFYSKFKMNPSELESIFALNEILGNSERTLAKDCQTLKELGFDVFGDLGDGELYEYKNCMEFDEETLARLASSFAEVYGNFSNKSFRGGKTPQN